MSDATFHKPHPSDPLRDRILHRVENLLCRFGLHDWGHWHPNGLFVRPGWERRSCWHCTKEQTRPCQAAANDT